MSVVFRPLGMIHIKSDCIGTALCAATSTLILMSPCSGGGSRKRAAAPAHEASVPSVASTPEQLNLLETDPLGLKRSRFESAEPLVDPPALILGRIFGICESSAAICVHTVLLVLALAYANASGAAAAGLSVLTLLHPALLYPVKQWYVLNREIYAWHGANPAQRSPSRVGTRQPSPLHGAPIAQAACPALAMPAVDRRQHGQTIPSKGSVTDASERLRAQMPPSNCSVVSPATWHHCPRTRSPPTARAVESSPLGAGVHSAVPSC